MAYLEFLKRIYPKGKKVKSRHAYTENFLFWFDKYTDNGFILGFYEEELVKCLVESIRPGFSFYDLGAHWGYFSLIGSKLVGSKGVVYAFEPMPQNFERLQKNVGINLLKNVHALNFAVSDRENSLKFSNTKDSYANTYTGNRANENTIEVKATSLDTFVLESVARPPDFIKIDVEGAEMDVLMGAEKLIKEYRPTIHLSTHDIHVSGIDEKCRAWMNKSNYKMNVISSKFGIADYLCVPE